MLPTAENVHIRDREGLEAKIKRMRAAGSEALQMVSDFDMTLTKFMVNGKRGQSCHGMVENGSTMSREFFEKTSNLKVHYHALEMDPNIPYSEKFGLMVEWWNKAHELMIAENVRQEYISDMVRHANAELREGTVGMFKELSAHNVPVFILSAGLQDILEEFLKQRDSLLSNMQVLSNKMKFNEEGVLVGFEHDIIHSLNKALYAARACCSCSPAPSPVHHNPETLTPVRPNIILMGDILEDLQMAAGVQYTDLLSIGFLNDPAKVPQLLEAYASHFDVVVTNDGGMEAVAQLVHYILYGEGPSQEGPSQ
eukprot:GILI01006304.1.p1 GENE.GILI01006304.1~~GILI01006304.1.p1  ORF type:complete len:310 (-),score=90.19 GILI01006304.1:98-1027(-)